MPSGAGAPLGLFHRHRSHHNFLPLLPLIPAALLLSLGITAGRYTSFPAEISLLLAAITWAVWLAAEVALRKTPQHLITHLALSLAILTGGSALYQLHQDYVPPVHLARLIQDGDHAPVALRLRVLAPPEDPSQHHGNIFWIGQISELQTDHGWIPAAGTVRIKSQAAIPLTRGQLVEAYGWAYRPDSNPNPGAFDMRAYLASDRIFLEVTANKPGAIRLLEAPSHATLSTALANFRVLLRSKLLEHTLRIDSESAYSMQALLLGYRDPSIDDVSRAFADAGVAHLLAISGSHIVFFAALVWGILRFLPLRPRTRLLLVGLLVAAYVLATPCGPPVLRAGLATAMFIISRLAARKPSLLNVLAGALIAVLIFRPTDLFNPGCQLSFISTAGLILLTKRCYTTLAGKWMQRWEEIARLAESRRYAWRLRATQFILGATVTNFVGTLTSLPLVAFHFNQINPLALVTGLLALPFVALTMIAALLQLLASLLSTPLAASLALATTAIAHLMVRTIQHLADLPGAVAALRAPPVWIVLLAYTVLLLWAFRRRLNLPRASIALVALAVIVTTLTWYTATSPRNQLRIDVLQTGVTAAPDQGSAILIHLPNGTTCLLNAGSAHSPALFKSAISPALRASGIRRLDALLISAADRTHASAARDVLDLYHPRALLISAVDFARQDWSLESSQLFAAANESHIPLQLLRAGDHFTTADLTATILWPPSSPSITDPHLAPAQSGLIILWQYANHRILTLDPTEQVAWSTLADNNIDLHCDTLLLLALATSTQLSRLQSLTSAQTILTPGTSYHIP